MSLECEVAIKIPTEVLLGLREEKSEFEEYSRKILAMNLYEKRRLSLGLCAQVAQMSKEDFIMLLGENRISIFDFDGKSEFEDELNNA